MSFTKQDIEKAIRKLKKIFGMKKTFIKAGY